MNRSMAGDTDDGGKVDNSRVCCVVTDSRASADPDACGVPGKAPDAASVAAVGVVGVWAAHGAATPQKSSKAMAIVNGQAALCFTEALPGSTFRSLT